MTLKLTNTVKKVLQAAAAALHGPARRLFIASVVAQMGRGGQRRVAAELHWNRGVVRKGLHELRSGIICIDAFAARGRKPLNVRQRDLEKDIRQIAEAASQTDPTFRTTRLYRRLTAKEVRRQLLEEKGYRPEQVLSERTLRRQLTAMGYYPRQVAKSKPVRKIKETNAIFEQLHQIHRQADADPRIARISLDTKAAVPIGDLSRGGKSRQGEHAADHDMEPELKLTPFGLFRPDTNETWLYFTTGSVTADFMVDRLEDIWPTLKKTVIVHIRW
jgi:hypothetical protein